MHVVVRVGIETALILAASVPLVAIGMWSSATRAWRPLLAFVALFALDDLVLLLPWIGPFIALTWGWQGKLLEVGGVLVLAATVRGLSLRDIGATAPLRAGWRTPALVVGTVSLALPIAFVLGLGARDQLTVEGWLFQATMPGLAEELLFRGTFLVLLDRAFGRPWRIAGSEVGWGTIVMALVFAAAHAVDVDRSGTVHVEPLFAIGPLIGSLFAGWARPRLGSLVPLILFHNVSNLVIPLATLWLS
ncbi:MAG: CPBP family intramembrane glutamic endopeptidase [Kofleriaceae bacterium]